MQSRDHLLTAREIESTLIDYWHDVDTNWGATAHEYYTEDGSYTTSARTRQGRAAIAEFYDVPNLISDCQDAYVRTDDGRWLCASRRLLPLFKSNTPTTA